MEKKMYIYFTCSILLIFNHIRYEIGQCKLRGWKYFYDGENYVDFLFAISFFLTFGFEIGFGTYLGNPPEEQPEDPRAEYTRISMSIMLLLGFLKGLTTLRAFTQFSFIVRMVVLVVKEMIPFLTLFLVFTIVCSMVMFVLGVHLGTAATPAEGEEPTNYQGLHFFGHIIFTLQNSLGSFEVD